MQKLSTVITRKLILSSMKKMKIYTHPYLNTYSFFHLKKILVFFWGGGNSDNIRTYRPVRTKTQLELNPQQKLKKIEFYRIRILLESTRLDAGF